MKKILSLALAIAMLILLVSCDFFPFTQNTNGGKKGGELARGTIDGNVYTSEYLGLSFTKPASWVYSTDEEIAEALNLGVDMFIKDNFKEALENSSAIYDMMVVDPFTRSNVNIGFEILPRAFLQI